MQSFNRIEELAWFHQTLSRKSIHVCYRIWKWRDHGSGRFFSKTYNPWFITLADSCLDPFAEPSINSTANDLQLPNRVVLQTINMPERIVYDQTISERQVDGKQIDFLTFICCGMICDHRFLQNLYKNYPNKKQLTTRPFADDRRNDLFLSIRGRKSVELW